jgi:Protein of unknown function (DUF732)
VKNKTSSAQKLSAITAVLALSLTACSSSKNSASPDPTSSVAGPSAWTADQKKYLDAINGADLASSIFLSASNYIEIGNTVCNGLKQGMPLEDILSALASSGKQNGLNEKQRNDFTLFTSAAAVSYLCVDQKEKYKLKK